MPNQPNSPFLFIGGRGRVYALDKVDGSIIWDIKLKSGFFKTGKDFVTLSEGLDFLFAFSYGIAFCIDKYTGNILWQREIKELKHEAASLAVDATLLGCGPDSGTSDTVDIGGDGDADAGDGGDGGGD